MDIAPDEKNISLKRWDRYSASYTTVEDRKKGEGKKTTLKTIKAGFNAGGANVFNTYSRDPENIGKGLPKLLVSKNLPPMPPSLHLLNL